jgi:L-methionine (R)-S-oxide reductase
LPDAAEVLAKIAECATCKTDRNELAQVAVAAIRERLPQASWVGVYWLEGDALVLGPYVGPSTEHVRIPVGTGVCGAAVAEDRDQVVDDVRQRSNYLACSPSVRSEIVVLVRRGGRVVGQLDLDSEQVGAFSRDDHAFLTMIAGALGSLLGDEASGPAKAPGA